MSGCNHDCDHCDHVEDCEKEGCTGDCSSCGGGCHSNPEDFLKPQNQYSNIKKVIAVMSGKGGVGKSMITSLLAVLAKREGFNVGILDADITGPSIPKCFGLSGKVTGSEDAIFPMVTDTEIKVISSNLLIDNVTDPIVWRGPVIAGLVEQFWTDVAWGDIDYLFVDMPPGTGDVPLTVFQSLPVDGIVVVTSPQDLVSMIVEKAVKMADLMNKNVLGIVENMSYFECPDCHKRHYIYGESHIEDVASNYNISAISKMPIDPTLPNLADKGLIETYYAVHLKEVMDKILELK